MVKRPVTAWAQRSSVSGTKVPGRNTPAINAIATPNVAIRAMVPRDRHDVFVFLGGRRTRKSVDPSLATGELYFAVPDTTCATSPAARSTSPPSGSVVSDERVELAFDSVEQSLGTGLLREPSQVLLES